jgi:predicted TIM-barrel enzyme
MIKVLPVIHYVDHETTLKQADLAFEAGADGVFLITHSSYCCDSDLLRPLITLRQAYTKKFIGLNLLSANAVEAFKIARDVNASGVWIDDPGITSNGVTPQGLELHAASKQAPHIEVYASVAFKYQNPEPNPPAAAHNAVMQGFIPTTSGAATGVPPDLEKIVAMYKRTQPWGLAVASGMTPDNVVPYVPYLSHILVSTGVSANENHFDYEKLCRFIALVRNVK